VQSRRYLSGLDGGVCPGQRSSVLGYQHLSDWSPEAISHTLSLVARLDADGYSQASIISMLVMEGAQ
jgi:hypothetical protein